MRDFPTKEDVLLTLYVELMQLRCFLIKWVEVFDARPRERFVAIAEINAILFPHPYSLGLIALVANVAARASAEVKQRMTEISEDFHRVRRVV